MKKFLFIFFFIFLLSSVSNASIKVLRWPSNTPSSVCQPSDTDSTCSGSWTVSGTNITSPSSDNVGIGSTTPQCQLDVGGTGKICVNGVQIGSGTLQDVYGGSGLTASPNPIIAIGTLSCNTANGTTFGCLTAADWTTFTNKQNSITTGTTSQYFLGDLSLATVPWVPSGNNIYNTNSTNVGINSTNPGQRLDIQGTVRATQFIKSGGTSSQFLKADGSTDSSTYLTGNQSITWTGSGDVSGSASGTTSISPSLTLSSTYKGWSLSGTNINTAGSYNVGIGSATPGQILDVQGTIRSTQFIDTGLTASKPTITDANKQFASGTYSGNTTTLATTTGSLTNGNFASWDSNGNAVASGTANTAAGIVGLFSTCSGTQYLGADGACHTASAGSNFWLNDTGNVGINTSYSVGIGTISQVNTLNVLGNVGIGTMAGDAYLKTAAPNGGMIVYGNVGVGTNIPTSNFQVIGNVAIGNITALQTIQVSGSAKIGPASINATGGTVSTSGGNQINTFTSSGTFTPATSGSVNYLVVAGGAGADRYGGGGGGGFRTGTLSVSGGVAYTITVGAGGTGGSNQNCAYHVGGNSTFSTITANGGGGSDESSTGAGCSGGSGGGTGYASSSFGTGNTPSTVPSQGNNGGIHGNGSPNYVGGGGGGAGAVGVDGSGTVAGNGGVGTANSLSGSSVTYAGGGGAGCFSSCTAGTGGSGGGGNGGKNGSGLTAGTANTGGGGGGGGDPAGANGGSGIVIISYPTGPSYLYLDSVSGNVGLGTQNPINTLSVGGSIGIGTAYSTIAGPTNGLIVQGNTGIGTSNPGQPLDVNGNVRVTGTNQYIAGSDGSVYVASSASTSGNMQLSTNSLVRETILNGGNVGIGTALPSSTLSVGGSMSIGASYTNGISAPANGLIVFGNVGIGSAAPQATIDLGTSGTLASHRTTGIGFSEHNSTNQACNTTCGSSACVVGLDIGTVGVINSGFVACTDAAADDCLCAGP